MIPLNTAPGTEVVCIEASSSAPDCPTKLTLGMIYTVKGWCEEFMTNKPLVDLEENYHDEFAWSPEYFRLLDLAGLDALLEARVKEIA